MIWHYKLNGPTRYGEYLIVSIVSLLNAEVPASDIHVSIHEEYASQNFFHIHVLRNLGVNLFIDETNPHTKALLIHNHLVNGHDVVQIDCDCVWRGDVKIDPTIRALSIFEKLSDNEIACWEKPANAMTFFNDRRCLLIPRYFRRDDTTEGEYTDWIYANTGIPIFAFYQWLKNRNQWPLGGLVFYPAKLVRSESWPLILIHGKISCCDETAIVLASYAKSLRITDLSETKTLTHTVNPTHLSFDEVKGQADFVHFAGDHYRLHNTENRNKILSKYTEALKQVL